MRYTLELIELLMLDRVMGLWLWLVGLRRVQRQKCRFHSNRSVGSIEQMAARTAVVYNWQLEPQMAAEIVAAARAHRLVGMRCKCLLWQSAGGAIRQWCGTANEAATVAAVVAAAADTKRAAEGRAASMRICILQLEEIVLRLRPSGWFRQFFLERHGHMDHYYEEQFFRTWHSKYLFEWYGD